MPRRARYRYPVLLLAILGAAAAVALIAHSDSSIGSGKPWIGVRGNKLVDHGGNTVRLLGVNRPGLEYECVEGQGVFDGPTDAAAIGVMKRWDINVVRVPLNESCWLGHEWLDENRSRSAYREAVHGFVERLEQAGLYVILDLQWSAPGENLATGIIPMASEHAPQFWREVATEYRDDRSLIFDLYNEPHDISWDCWESGCDVSDQYFGSYRTVGMRELVEVVRSTGAEQPILLSGIDWARDLRGWLEHRPPDPAHALVASNHTYEQPIPCYRVCRAAIKTTARTVPVVTGEIGEEDCNHDYIDNYMRWADRNGISYLGWAWYPKSGCDPSLIENFAGKPTPLGIGLREHLRVLHSSRRSR